MESTREDERSGQSEKDELSSRSRKLETKVVLPPPGKKAGVMAPAFNPGMREVEADYL